MNQPAIVSFGRRVPVPAIVGYSVPAVLVAALIATQALTTGHGAIALLALPLRLLPAIGIPVVVITSTWAEYDPATGLIVINGRAPIPLRELRFAGASMARGVLRLVIGPTPADGDGFMVSSAVLRSSDVERAWIHALLPAMGLASDPASAHVDVASEFFPSLPGRPVTLEQAQRFTADWAR